MSSPEIGPNTPMAEILAAYPSAKVGLFQRYHFAVTIVSPAFEGKALVERHQMVYRALDPLMARIHASQLKTVSPGEA